LRFFPELIAWWFLTIQSYPLKEILSLKDDIRPESCFGWNRTIRIRKLSKNVSSI